MTTSKRHAKRCVSIFAALLLLFALALSAQAGAASTTVCVEFWKEHSAKASLASEGIDTGRDATLTRSANGTYTLVLPVKQVSKLGVTGCLTGITIGDIAYDGELTGDVADGTGVLTIKNLPASVLTGSDINNALLVTCNIRMDSALLGTINTAARMCLWAE